ncbi:EEF1A lysine methyltransferase 3-like [Callorhinchus milii]|uniref:Protein-lysine methyltransferase METTL21B-like n=1 Tax=Callorhinchus milii TaxID=7868 RepID=A0A4W3JEG2_CALMI|nr:EEF1A lysine methyltransferase 3-like [Callorhinchus milii]|eukprot:gi/632977209/ref/XP_007905221.1/ PREDICTED: protein-lysine methyltransferase METTL21B-like [Callorhinchus milii]
MALPQILSRKEKLPDWIEDCYEVCGYKLRIIRMIGSNLEYSSTIWEAGLVLCQYFEKEKMDFTGKKVIELGSGTGIVGILAALLGGNITLTDQSYVLPQIQNNMNNNIPASIMHRSKVSVLCWGENHKDFPSDYDYIIGSDIVYSLSSYNALIETLKSLSNPNTVIFISSQMRPFLKVSEFHNSMLPVGFNSEIIFSDNNAAVNVYKLTKKCPATEAQDRY